MFKVIIKKENQGNLTERFFSTLKEAENFRDKVIKYRDDVEFSDIEIVEQEKPKHVFLSLILLVLMFSQTLQAETFKPFGNDGWEMKRFSWVKKSTLGLRDHFNGRLLGLIIYKKDGQFQAVRMAMGQFNPETGIAHVGELRDEPFNGECGHLVTGNIDGETVFNLWLVRDDKGNYSIVDTYNHYLDDACNDISKLDLYPRTALQ